MNPRSHVAVVEQLKMPEPNHIMRTYMEFLSFLTQLRRLKTSVAPAVINEKYGLSEIGKGTELILENGSGESFQEPSEKKEIYKPPTESSSSGKDAGVSIDADINLEREDPPAPLTPIIIIANRNPVEVVDIHSEVATKPAVKKKKLRLREDMDFSVRATRDFIDFRRPQRPMSKHFIIFLAIASFIYVLACFGFTFYRRLQWNGDDIRTINMTRINPHLPIFETNKTDIFDMMNENVTSNSLL